jgi:DNA-binding transcriptional regulator YiaG
MGGRVSKQYRSGAMASIHETAEGLHDGGVMDKQAMRKFDEACLTLVRAGDGRIIAAPNKLSDEEANKSSV